MRCHQRADQTYNRNLHESRKGNRIGDLRSIPLEHLRSELYDFIASGAFGFIECHVGVFDDFHMESLSCGNLAMPMLSVFVTVSLPNRSFSL